MTSKPTYEDPDTGRCRLCGKDLYDHDGPEAFCPQIPHECGPECEPGWRLRDIIEFGSVSGHPATMAVVDWDALHKAPGRVVTYRPRDVGVRYGNEEQHACEPPGAQYCIKCGKHEVVHVG